MSTCSSYVEFRHKAPTDNDLHLTYNSGLLPLQPNGDMDRENGILKSTAVDTIILNLKNSGIIPTLTNTDLFIKKQNDLIQNVKSEYCFYYSRLPVLKIVLRRTYRGLCRECRDVQYILRVFPLALICIHSFLALS